MSRITTEIYIDATPEQVWEVATDLHQLEHWVTIHRAFPETPPAHVETGSRFGQKLKVAGTKFSVTWTATEVARPSRLAWDGDGPAGTTAHTSYTLEPHEGGTRFRYENEFTVPAGKAGKAAARLVARQAEKHANESLGKLKDLVEG